MKNTAIFGFPRLLEQPWRSAVRLVSDGGGIVSAGHVRRRSPPLAAKRRGEAVETEVDEIGGTHDLQGDEDGLRGDDQRGEPCARRDRPHDLAERHTRGSRDTGSATARQRVAHGQRRVRVRA